MFVDTYLSLFYPNEIYDQSIFRPIPPVTLAGSAQSRGTYQYISQRQSFEQTRFSNGKAGQSDKTLQWWRENI
jgi:hypothetical protein